MSALDVPLPEGMWAEVIEPGDRDVAVVRVHDGAFHSGVEVDARVMAEADDRRALLKALASACAWKLLTSR